MSADHRRHRRKSRFVAIAQAVAAKLEDGNLQAAIRILSSEDTPAAPSADGLAKLQEKHPPATLSASSLPSPDQFLHMAVVEDDVRKAVQSFPAGSSGGPDGLRPQHLKELIGCREAGSDFLTALTAFVNMLMAGKCPINVAPIFFGGRLIALDKKSGGIRPIAIGLTLRRLASKCANAAGVTRLADYFRPRQLDVGTPGGCEAAVHAARRYLQSMPADHVMVKLDFSNAFNSLHREDMLLAVRDRLPDLYAYCHSAYARPSRLFYGPYTVMSSEGSQQGDPLGGLLFCNAAQPLLESLEAQLTLGYMDDVTLGGLQSVVAKDIRRVLDVGASMGLMLNTAKSELIAHPDTTVNDPLLQSFCRVTVADASLLGAPIFTGPVLDGVWKDRCADLSRAVERLQKIGAQDALILLRASFSAPRVQYLMRCSPSVDHPALIEFDNQLRSAVRRITNSDLSDDQWLQASLPIKLGGLGIRRVASLALPAFLASAASTLLLQDAILSQLPCLSDTFLVSSLSTWSAVNGAMLPPGAPLPPNQSFWDRPGLLVDQAIVRSSRVDPHSKARFLAAMAPHSGDWLLALPITSCGLRMDDEAVRVAIALRLGLSLCVPHLCQCGAQVDAWGLHAFVCRRAPGKTQRHHAVNDVVARAFASAGVPVSKEPSGLSRSDGKRPDGVTLIPWQAGRPLAWDVTIASTLADSYVSATAGSAGAAAEMAATRKNTKYANLPANYSFLPIALETLGSMNSSAMVCLTELGRRISDVSGEEREGLFLFQRLSILLQRFNSVLLHDSFTTCGNPDL
jgi:hypothetical protein